jgi:hypothetical protein
MRVINSSNSTSISILFVDVGDGVCVDAIYPIFEMKSRQIGGEKGLAEQNSRGRRRRIEELKFERERRGKVLHLS